MERESEHEGSDTRTLSLPIFIIYVHVPCSIFPLKIKHHIIKNLTYSFIFLIFQFKYLKIRARGEIPQDGASPHLTGPVGTVNGSTSCQLDIVSGLYQYHLYSMVGAHVILKIIIRILVRSQYLDAIMRDPALECTKIVFPCSD